MKLRHLAVVPVLTLAAIGAELVAPTPATAECVTADDTTICTQGDGRSPDAGVLSPYPCEHDWYCYDGMDVVFDTSSPSDDDGESGRPARPNNDLPGRDRPRRGRGLGR